VAVGRRGSASGGANTRLSAGGLVVDGVGAVSGHCGASSTCSSTMQVYRSIVRVCSSTKHAYSITINAYSGTLCEKDRKIKNNRGGSETIPTSLIKDEK